MQERRWCLGVRLIIVALTGQVGAGCDNSGRLDPDGNGLELAEDCSDTDPNVGAPGACYADADGDGFGDPGAPAPAACTCPVGTSADDQDCDDAEAAVSPGEAQETCLDGLVNACPVDLDAAEVACALTGEHGVGDALFAQGGLVVDGDAGASIGGTLTFSLGGLALSSPDAGHVGLYQVLRAGGALDLEAEPEPGWDGQGDDLAGAALAGVVNGETSWLLVGAPRFGGAGAVYALHEGLFGGDLEAQAQEPLYGASEGEELGAAVAAGDLDGDGVLDLVAGAPGADEGAGRVVLVSGADVPGLWDPEAEGEISSDDVQSLLSGGEAGDRLGVALAIADLDGDGAQDLAVGAPGVGLEDDGAVFVRWGDAEKPDQQFSNDSTAERRGAALAAGPETPDSEGASLMVGCPASVNHDDEACGRVILVRPEDWSELASNTFATLDGDEEGAELGVSVAWGTDLDFDGRNDALVGAPGAGGGAGAVLGVWWQDSGGVRDASQNAVFTLTGATAGDRLGASLAAGEDDPQAEAPWGLVAVGAPGHGDGGAVYLLRVSAW